MMFSCSACSRYRVNKPISLSKLYAYQYPRKYCILLIFYYHHPSSTIIYYISVYSTHQRVTRPFTNYSQPPASGGGEQLIEVIKQWEYFIIIVKVMLKTLDGKAHETAVSKTIIKEMRQKFYESLAVQQERVPDLWPKKGKVVAYKTKSGDDRKSEHIVIDQQTHFMQIEGYVIPTLKTVHSYPNLYPRFVADAGAIRFILKGANVMAPGLTNEQSHMDDVKAGAIVAIYVHGHEHAVAIGVTTKSTAEIRAEKQGIAVETIHFVGDGFWSMLYKK